MGTEKVERNISKLREERYERERERKKKNV